MLVSQHYFPNIVYDKNFPQKIYFILPVSAGRLLKTGKNICFLYLFGIYLFGIYLFGNKVNFFHIHNIFNVRLRPGKYRI